MTYPTYTPDMSTGTDPVVKYEYRVVYLQWNTSSSELNNYANEGYVVESITSSGSSTSWIVMMKRKQEIR